MFPSVIFGTAGRQYGARKDHLFEIGDDGAERVAVIRVAVQRLGVQHELPALGHGDRGDNRDLAAELVGRPDLAFADALHLGGVQRVDFGSALKADPQRQIEQRAEAVFERGIGLDLAADVADDAAEPGAQEFELAASALELMGMAVAPHHDGGALGQAQIVWRSLTPSRFARSTSFSIARWMSRASVGWAIAFSCTVVSTTTRSRSLVSIALVRCATERLSCSSAAICSSPSR